MVATRTRSTGEVAKAVAVIVSGTVAAVTRRRAGGPTVSLLGDAI